MFVLNCRVVLHAIDATPARWQHPRHWLISTQVDAVDNIVGPPRVVARVDRGLVSALRAEALVGRLDVLELLFCAAGVGMRCFSFAQVGRAHVGGRGHRAFEP